ERLVASQAVVLRRDGGILRTAAAGRAEGGRPGEVPGSCQRRHPVPAAGPLPARARPRRGEDPSAGVTPRGPSGRTSGYRTYLSSSRSMTTGVLARTLWRSLAGM